MRGGAGSKGTAINGQKSENGECKYSVQQKIK